MAPTQRTYNLGRLAELKERANTLSVEIDSQVKAIVVHFDPMDVDLQYVKNIKPERLLVYVKSIERKKKELDKVLGEIARLQAEVGEGA